MGRIGERISWTARLKRCVDPARGPAVHHNSDLPIRDPRPANPARRRTCRGNRPEDRCKCRHLPTMITSVADCRGAPVRGALECRMRTPYCRARAASPLHLLHLLHSQSNHEIRLCPRPSQRCTRNAEGSLRPRGWRIPNLHSYWRLLIETRDRVFVQLFPTSCLMRRASSSPRSYSLLDES
jgi:hypothetical protein